MEDRSEFEIRECNELDAPELARVQTRALLALPISKIYAGLYEGDLQSSLTEVFKKTLKNPDSRWFKAVAGAREVIIGFSRWDIKSGIRTQGGLSLPGGFITEDFFEKDHLNSAAVYSTTNSSSLRKLQLAMPDSHAFIARQHVTNLAVEFQNQTNEARACYAKNLHGKRHVCLKHLFVTPTRQGKGVGSKLLSWGLDYCDAEGIPCYMTAFEDEDGMFGDKGFCQLEGWKIDLNNWAIIIENKERSVGLWTNLEGQRRRRGLGLKGELKDETHQQWCLLRQPKTDSSQSDGETEVFHMDDIP